jgi:hypothetical protein
MPFPYMYPIGALIAGIILGATLTVFGLVLRALDRAVTRVADGICSGLVSGFRGWSEQHPAVPSDRSPRATGSDGFASPVRVQPVHRT